MKKNKVFKFVMIVLDVVAICALILVTTKWVINHNLYQKVIYKNFTVMIPKETSYDYLDEFVLELNAKSYDAYAEIMLNEDNFIFEDYQKFADTLVEDGFEVGEYYEMDVSGTKVLVFKNYKDNSEDNLCFFKINDQFVVKVEMFNLNTTKFEDNIANIVKLFTKAVYKKSKNIKHQYHYFMPND